MPHFASLRLALVVAGLALAGAAHADTTVFDDSFESGLGGTTSYTPLGQGSYTTPGYYGLVDNPATYWTNGYSSYYDHTFGTADGRMLFFDGAPTSVPIISQTANLVAGQSYTVSYWASSSGADSVPTTQLYMNGMVMGTSNTTTLATWTPSSVTFTAGQSGTATFYIVDLNTATDGNDGALDDFKLTTPVPEPAPWALLLAGVAALGVAARRRRAS